MHVHHYPDTLTALRSLKQVGAYATSKQPQNYLQGKSQLTRIKLTQLSYHIGYFIAQKGENASA